MQLEIERAERANRARHASLGIPFSGAASGAATAAAEPAQHALMAATPQESMDSEGECNTQ